METTEITGSLSTQQLTALQLQLLGNALKFNHKRSNLTSIVERIREQSREKMRQDRIWKRGMPEPGGKNNLDAVEALSEDVQPDVKLEEPKIQTIKVEIEDDQQDSGRELKIVIIFWSKIKILIDQKKLFFWSKIEISVEQKKTIFWSKIEILVE